MDVHIILKLAGVGLLTAIVCVILKKTDRDEIAPFAPLGGLVLVAVLVIDMLGGLFDTLRSILSLY